MHRKVAEDVHRDLLPRRTLEIGAGNLNHLQYEPQGGPYDVVEALSHLAENSSRRSRVVNIYRDLAEIRDH
jgi:hypothetical protein